MRRVAAVLCHHPVLDRQHEIVTSAITNMDMHDIARSAHTYGLSDFFIAHPVEAQRALALRVRAHWTEGPGGRRIPDRIPAMEALSVVANLDEAVDAMGGRTEIEIWVTSARASVNALALAAAREQLEGMGPPVLLVFGTGWGLADELLEIADARLAPVLSPRPDGYNHLSVRAAAAILFDRLLGLP